MGKASEERPWTVEEFLNWVQHQDQKWELVRGFPQLKFMAGGKRRHHDVAGNAYFAIRNRLTAPCRPYTADMAVRTTESQTRFPDVVVDCGKRDPEDLSAAEPTLIVEVLSSRTRAFDLTDKLAEYKAVPSIRYILLVEAGDCAVAVHERSPDGWTKTYYNDPSDVIDMPALGVHLPLGELYEDVQLPPRLKVIRK